MRVCMILMNLDSVKHDARVRKEAGSLTKMGYRVRLIAMRHRGEDLGKGMDGFELRLFYLWTRNLPKNMLCWFLKYVEFNIKVLVRILVSRAKVYHAHDLDALVSAWLAARITGAKVVYDSHELFTERPIRAVKVWRRVERYLINRVDAVIAANHDRAEIMFREYGARDLPRVIMNCPSAANGSEVRSVTVRETLPPEVRAKKILLYQGCLSPNRCLESLIVAAKYLDERAILVFIGTSSLFSEDVLKKLVIRYGLEGRVFFKEAVDSKHLVHHISSADIGVVIYKNSCRNNYLCAPNKVFDYCMAGLPSIGCDFPPIRRIAERYGTSVLFDAEDPKSIASAANSLIENDTGMAAAKAATAVVASEFSWEREERKLKELYGSIFLNKKEEKGSGQKPSS